MEAAICKPVESPHLHNSDLCWRELRSKTWQLPLPVNHPGYGPVYCIMAAGEDIMVSMTGAACLCLGYKEE